MTGGTGDGDSVVVDARRRRCPLPVIDLARAARQVEPGTTIELLADDPAAVGDVAAWCRMRGHALVSSGEPDDEGVRRFVVQVAETRA